MVFGEDRLPNLVTEPWAVERTALTCQYHNHQKPLAQPTSETRSTKFSLMQSGCMYLKAK